MRDAAKVIGLLTVVMIMVCPLFAALRLSFEETPAITDLRFEVISCEYSEGCYRSVVKDTKTGIYYLESKTGNGLAITPLLDASGNQCTD